MPPLQGQHLGRTRLPPFSRGSVSREGARPRQRVLNIWCRTPPVRRRPSLVQGFSGARGWRGKQTVGKKTQCRPSLISARGEKGGEPRKQAGPAPELPPERLLNCVSAPLALRRGGWNPREPPGQSPPRFFPTPANGSARSWGVRETAPTSYPPACVWARLAAGSWLGGTCLRVVRPGLLWRSPAWAFVSHFCTTRRRGSRPGISADLSRRRAQPGET